MVFNKHISDQIRLVYLKLIINRLTTFNSATVSIKLIQNMFIFLKKNTCC